MKGMNKMAKKKPTFEEAMARLEEIVAQMERGDAPLEESLTLFEEGTKLLKKCTSLLDKAEQQVSLLTKDDQGALQEVPFQEEG